ncbi:MAG TPA: ABC transporter ATP-binding protein [Anaerolineaceae bacterium]|jgi:oligopeptide/dipeptide ABC transporter ATP-binding protein
MAPIVELRNVSKFFGSGPSRTVALDDMTFSVDEDFAKIVTIAGESGSGKTTILMLLLGFYDPSLGSVMYRGKDLRKLDKDDTVDFRRNVQAVFQDPFAVYNPFYKVDNLLSIPIKNFKIAKGKEESRHLMETALTRVGLRPEETLGRFPHQLSGGQRQRIAVARALILKPKILLADEPVSMVDASLRATLLKQIRDLNQELQIPILYITHDLTTSYHVSDYIIVLYHGSVMEAGNVEEVIRSPKHPYTKLLVNSIPWPDPNMLWGATAEEVKGKAAEFGTHACKFTNRCPHAFEPCYKEQPDLFRTNKGTQVAACFLFQGSETLAKDKLGTLFTK